MIETIGNIYWLKRGMIYRAIFSFLQLISIHLFSQCAPEMGIPSPNLTFNTGADGSGSTRPPGAQDLNWRVSLNSLTGSYDPAFIMTSYPMEYYKGSLLAYTWISFSATGTHSGSQDFYFRKDFNLPCRNLCGKSYSEENVFCLDLTMYVDNSVREIFVNGIAQGRSVGIIPAADPYRPPGTAGAVKTSVSLCKDWKAGANSIIIQVASSAIVTGLLVESSFRTPPLTDTLSSSICEGEVFRWRNKSLTKNGFYFDTIRISPGCDSVKTLKLTVFPKAEAVISQSICEGQSFAGYSRAGIYIDTFITANGCDSVRTINLTVQSRPEVLLETNQSYCSGDSLRLFPGEFLSYLWQDGSTQNNFVAKVPGIYNVRVTNACGSLDKEFIVAEKHCNILFPNVFSPNRDGRNDVFKMLSSFLFEEYLLTVYDRWGQRVFQSASISNGWDGTFKGSAQPQGVFVWYCRYKRMGQVSSMKGTVLLVR